MITSTPYYDRLALADMRARLRALTVRLFANDATPARGDTAADYVEPAWPGYAPVVGLDLGYAVQQGDGPVIASAARLSWTRTSGAGDDVVYGWFATDPDGVLCLAERRTAGPWAMGGPGARFDVALRVQLADMT